jgi:dsRNA-specific ribonuclease
MKEREITALEQGLGYHFRRRSVIEQAVTHSSQAREQEAQQIGKASTRSATTNNWNFSATRS